MLLQAENVWSDIFPQLSHSGAELLIETLEGLSNGSVKGQAQDESQATLAPILTREDGRMNLTERPAKQVYDRWRGFFSVAGSAWDFSGQAVFGASDVACLWG